MLKYLSFLSIVFSCFAGTCQIEIIPGALNFGLTNLQTEWIADVHITNRGTKKDILLRSTFSHEYEVMFTSKTILPDSTIVMRVKFSPRIKGTYHDEVELYFASMNVPLIFKIDAIVDYQNPDDHLPCPDFSSLSVDCCKNNMFIIEVIDEDTGKEIPQAQIGISESGVQRMKMRTSNEGKVGQTIPIGYYDIHVSADGYMDCAVSGYINHHYAYFKIKLKRKAQRQPELLNGTEVIISTRDSLLLPIDLLPTDKFSPNNIVYLLDVSSSMSQGEKLDLMKGALIQLSSVLRTQDKITLISYSDDAKIILETTTGVRIVEIQNVVNDLHADGSTSGALGFKSSYNVLNREYLTGGNNQLVVITDGVFQPADQQRINKLVKKARKKKFVTSIVGVQCASFAITKLTDVTTLGGGSFIQIQDENDLSVLIDELKRRSAK